MPDMHKLACSGGATTKRRYGVEHYRSIGAMGGRAGKHRRQPQIPMLDGDPPRPRR
ncbi:MAG: hypothetical protein ACREML_01905 [Vulcanimicrobiaceae bacterium]